MTSDSKRVRGIPPVEEIETPPGVADLMKLYEGIEDIYRNATSVTPSYSEWSLAANSTNLRPPMR